MRRKWAKILEAIDEALDAVRGIIAMAVEFGREPDARHIRRADLLKKARRDAVEKERLDRRKGDMAARLNAFGDSAAAIEKYHRSAKANAPAVVPHSQSTGEGRGGGEEDAEIHQ